MAKEIEDVVHCKDCKWWKQKEAAVGECRGTTPNVISAVVMSPIGRPEAKIMFYFPMTHPKLYCRLGELKAAVLVQ